MNASQLLRFVRLGHLVLVGEVRGADVREAGYVDKKTGLKVGTWVLTCFVELTRENAFKMAKITRHFPRDSATPAPPAVDVEKGRAYAFEIESVKREHNFILAGMGKALPIAIDFDLAVLAVDAPSGAATGCTA